MNESNDNQLVSTPSIEIILRSVQKDTEYINVLNNKSLKFIDSFSHFFAINPHSENLEIISKLIFYFCSFISRKAQNTPGEEYTNIRQDLTGKKTILGYIIFLSLKNLILRLIHDKISKSLQAKVNKINLSQMKNEHVPKSFYYKLFDKILILHFDNFPSFEIILEKIEEIQYCLFFLQGNYFDIAQRIFQFGYTKLVEKDRNNVGELIDSKGFLIIGYLLGAKIIVEIFQKIKNFILLINEERKNIFKEEDLENDEELYLKHINIKLKQTDLKKGKVLQNEENNNCLLCLDIRKDTSSTICGHLFCWGCITKYLQNTPNCPFCRKECHPQNVLLLQNYI